MKVIAVAAGWRHTMMVKQDGSLWATGYNNRGQLGTGATDNRVGFVKVLSEVKSVSGGSSHAMAIKQDGSLWAAGLNNYGQLGDGTKTQRNKYVKVVDGGVKDVVAGQYFSVLLNDKHELCVTGYNHHGMLGTGDKTDVVGFDKKCYPRPGPCYANNGGCHSKRTCIADKGSAKCGDCPAGYINDGAKGCKC